MSPKVNVLLRVRVEPGPGLLRIPLGSARNGVHTHSSSICFLLTLRLLGFFGLVGFCLFVFVFLLNLTEA